jgi:CRP-like cAMP-binding protein
MPTSELGRVYRDGEPIVHQGEVGDCMYVIQSGEVEVVDGDHGGEVPLAVLGPGDFFGEMSIFEREVRSATVRARGEARVLTVDRRTLMRRIQRDPTLAFNLLKTMSRRIRRLNAEVAHGRRAVEHLS